MVCDCLLLLMVLGCNSVPLHLFLFVIEIECLYDYMQFNCYSHVWFCATTELTVNLLVAGYLVWRSRPCGPIQGLATPDWWLPVRVCVPVCSLLDPMVVNSRAYWNKTLGSAGNIDNRSPGRVSIIYSIHMLETDMRPHQHTTSAGINCLLTIAN